MDDSKLDKNRDKLNFVSNAISISDLSQLSIAVAIGLFGISAISIGIDRKNIYHLIVVNTSTTYRKLQGVIISSEYLIIFG